MTRVVKTRSFSASLVTFALLLVELSMVAVLTVRFNVLGSFANTDVGKEGCRVGYLKGLSCVINRMSYVVVLATRCLYVMHLHLGATMKNCVIFVL